MENLINDKDYLRQLCTRIQNNSIIEATTNCWLWQLSKDRDGYGYITISRAKRKNQKAHRISWMAFNGTLIPKHLVLRHKCNNPACCNPEHLHLGTETENNRDRFLHNQKYARNNKLDQMLIFDLYAMRDAGATAEQIAKHFKITEHTARQAYLGKTYKHCYKSYYGEE